MESCRSTQPMNRTQRPPLKRQKQTQTTDHITLLWHLHLLPIPWLRHPRRPPLRNNRPHIAPHNRLIDLLRHSRGVWHSDTSKPDVYDGFLVESGLSHECSEGGWGGPGGTVGVVEEPVPGFDDCVVPVEGFGDDRLSERDVSEMYGGRVVRRNLRERSCRSWVSWIGRGGTCRWVPGANTEHAIC